MEDRYDVVIVVLFVVGFGALYLIGWATMRLLETSATPTGRAWGRALRRFSERVGRFLDRYTDDSA